jgi:hypothetical protein
VFWFLTLTARAAEPTLNPDIALIGDFAAAVFTADEPMMSGAHDPTANGFNLQQLELTMSEAVDPYFRFDANIVFSLFGVEIEEAFATTTGLPGGLQVRVGQFLTRFGRINPTHPHSWAFVDQPFAVGRIFGGEGNRGLGVEGSILLPLPWYVEAVVSQTTADGAATARSFYGGDNLGVDRIGDLQTTAALKQFHALSDDWSLLWGLSFASGPNASGRDNRTEVYGGDIFVKYRPVGQGSHQEVSLHSEWMHRRRQIPDDVLADLSGFTQLSWRFAQRWDVAGRYELGTAATDLSGALTVDPLDPEWSRERQRIALASTFSPTEFSRLRLQGEADLPGWQLQREYAAFLAAEFSIGAHGAHNF